MECLLLLAIQGLLFLVCRGVFFRVLPKHAGFLYMNAYFFKPSNILVFF